MDGVPTPRELQLEQLRKAAQRASLHPLLPRDVRDAIALLVGVIGSLSADVEQLRADLARVAVHRA